MFCTQASSMNIAQGKNLGFTHSHTGGKESEWHYRILRLTLRCNAVAVICSLFLSLLILTTKNFTTKFKQETWNVSAWSSNVAIGSTVVVPGIELNAVIVTDGLLSLLVHTFYPHSVKKRLLH